MKQPKPLTAKQAYNCEHAREPKCVCRCGGRLHGARRGGATADGEMDRGFFESLPADDPHYLYSAAVLADRRKQQARERAERKRAEREESERRKWEYIASHLPQREQD